MARQNQNSSNNSNAFLFIMVAVALGFLVLMNNPKEQGIVELASVSQRAAETEAVNRNLYYTQKRMQLDQDRMALNNKYFAPAVGDIVLPFRKPASPIDFSADTREARVVEDLKVRKPELQWQNPNNEIMAELHDQDRVEEYVEAYKESYARQFIDNARKNGYIVTLDGNYRVVSVTPMKRVPGSTQSYDQFGSGSQ